MDAELIANKKSVADKILGRVRDIVGFSGSVADYAYERLSSVIPQKDTPSKECEQESEPSQFSPLFSELYDSLSKISNNLQRIERLLGDIDL